MSCFTLLSPLSIKGMTFSPAVNKGQNKNAFEAFNANETRNYWTLITLTYADSILRCTDNIQYHQSRCHQEFRGTTAFPSRLRLELSGTLCDTRIMKMDREHFLWLKLEYNFEFILLVWNKKWTLVYTIQWQWFHYDNDVTVFLIVCFPPLSRDCLPSRDSTGRGIPHTAPWEIK